MTRDDGCEWLLFVVCIYRFGAGGFHHRHPWG
nr:MAG TPA: hypothetical protein [Caudoviricetes sp.]